MLLKKKNKIGDTPVHGAASRGHIWYGDINYNNNNNSGADPGWGA